MDSKKLLVAVALLFTLINGAFVFAANEPYKKLYTSFGLEDPDPDLDGVLGYDDKCPGSVFSFFVLNTAEKKDKNFLSLNGTYIKLQQTNQTNTKKTKTNTKNKTTNGFSFQTSASADFKKGVKTYALPSGKIITVDSLKKRVKLVYSNTLKGFAVLWMSDMPGKKTGCTLEDEQRAKKI